MCAFQIFLDRIYPNNIEIKNTADSGFVTRLTRRVQLVEQELLTHPEHLSLPPVFSGICATRSLVLYVCFVDRCLSFCPFSFGHCVLCSSIYGFWLLLCYLQTLLKVGFIYWYLSWNWWWERLRSKLYHKQDNLHIMVNKIFLHFQESMIVCRARLHLPINLLLNNNKNNKNKNNPLTFLTYPRYVIKIIISNFSATEYNPSEKNEGGLMGCKWVSCVKRMTHFFHV